MITVIQRQKDLPISASSVRRLVDSFLYFYKINVDEVGIHFVTEKAICQLHQDFFNDPSPTDCISFPMDTPSMESSRTVTGVLGEVFVCPKTAVIYAKQHHLNPLKETTLYVIHGLLHLLGYDDISPKERSQMRKHERRFLKFVEAHQLWLVKPHSGITRKRQSITGSR